MIADSMAPYVCFHIFSKVKVTVSEWPPIGKIAAHSAYEMFSWYKYLIVSLVFSYLGFWSGNLFLIAPFPDLCLLVPFSYKSNKLRNEYTTRSTARNVTKNRKFKIIALIRDFI